jgi:hypothetical protein
MGGNLPRRAAAPAVDTPAIGEEGCIRDPEPSRPPPGGPGPRRRGGRTSLGPAMPRRASASLMLADLPL